MPNIQHLLNNKYSITITSNDGKYLISYENDIITHIRDSSIVISSKLTTEITCSGSTKIKEIIAILAELQDAARTYYKHNPKIVIL